MRAPSHSSLLEHFLKLRLELEPFQQTGGEQAALFLGLNQGCVLALRLGFLGLIGSEQTALELVQVGMAKCVRTNPPDDECANPNGDGDYDKHGFRPPTPRQIDRRATGFLPPAAFRRTWDECR